MHFDAYANIEFEWIEIDTAAETVITPSATGATCS